jgi:hypothetical protein
VRNFFNDARWIFPLFSGFVNLIHEVKEDREVCQHGIAIVMFQENRDLRICALEMLLTGARMREVVDIALLETDFVEFVDSHKLFPNAAISSFVRRFLMDWEGTLGRYGNNRFNIEAVDDCQLSICHNVLCQFMRNLGMNSRGMGGR